MKKITLQLLLVLTSTFGYAQNLITNGTLDDASGWTVRNQYGTDSTNGSVTFANGSVNINKIDASDDGWIQMGIYSSVTLTAGWYQFDMDMTFDGINSIWGEVYIGSVEPVQNSEYSGDKQVIKAYNAWDCAQAYSGKAVSFGCDDTNPGKFEITADATYYILFRSGGAQFGASGVSLDNFTLTRTTAPPALVLLKDFNLNFDTVTPLIAAESAVFNDDATNTVINENNPTVNVGEISGINNSWWSQIKYQYNDGINLSSGDRGFSIKVKGPRALPVTIKIEGSQEHSVTVDYTTPDVWQKLDFDFSSFATNTNTKIAVFFDIQVNPDVVTDPNLNIFQVDDFIFGQYATLTNNSFKIEIEELVAYPNPTSSTWKISTKNQVISSIELFNLLGDKVLSLKPNALHANVDASSLTAGRYIANITTELGKVSRKLIKQ
jgi:hypothetical protein